MFQHKAVLKTIFNSIFFLSLFLLLFSLPQSLCASSEDIRQIAVSVTYVAADYSEAVNEKGEIKSLDEFTEQKNLILDAKKLVLELPNEDIVTEPKPEKKALLLQNLDRILAALEAKKTPLEIRLLCHQVEEQLVSDFGFKVEPKEPLESEKTKSLYAQNCASCHGSTGHADTATALKPPPVSFHDQERMAKISPTLAYYAVSYGVKGTAMMAFSQLTEQERWSLAFYVTGLRYQNKAQVKPDARLGELYSLSKLAQIADEELMEKLHSRSFSQEEAEKTLAYLRAKTPFEPIVKPAQKRFQILFAMLEQIKEATRQNDMKGADHLAHMAYLEQFEVQEKRLRGEAPELTQEIEALFTQNLYKLTGASSPNQTEIENTIARIQKKLNQADDVLSGSMSSFWACFVPVFGITLREGFETLLLVGFLLAFLRKSGQASKSYLVHWGWMLAVAFGVMTYFVLEYIIQTFFHKPGVSGTQVEWIEAISTVLALAILLPMTHSILGAKEARHWLGFLGKKLTKVQDSNAPTQNLLGQKFLLFCIAFLATYREMVETILFYRATLTDGGPFAHKALLFGVLSGAAIIALLGFMIHVTGKRLNPKPMMKISSIFLGLFCVVLAGQAIHSFQEIGRIASHGKSLGFLPSFPLFGFYATWEGIIVQVLVLFLVFFPSLLVSFRKRKTL